jgi:hypothetical protein
LARQFTPLSRDVQVVPLYDFMRRSFGCPLALGRVRPEALRFAFHETHPPMSPNVQIYKLVALNFGHARSPHQVCWRFALRLALSLSGVYHEPYYRSYLEEDFAAIAAKCGLVHVRDVTAFIAKVMVFRKADR